MSALEVRRLADVSTDEFYRVHCAANAAELCCCVAWWVRTWDGWGERTAEQNRRLRDELFARGERDGYLGYLDERPVAWCQVGPRSTWPKLERQLEVVPDEPADERAPTWAVPCFFVAPHARGRGVARALLAAVLDDLEVRGVRRVEAYPRCAPADGAALDEGELWNGPEALFRAAGFELVRQGAPRSILARDLG